MNGERWTVNGLRCDPPDPDIQFVLASDYDAPAAQLAESNRKRRAFQGHCAKLEARIAALEATIAIFKDDPFFKVCARVVTLEAELAETKALWHERSGTARTQAIRITELEELLRWMNRRGGLGLDVHARIDATLASQGETSDGIKGVDQASRIMELTDRLAGLESELDAIKVVIHDPVMSWVEITAQLRRMTTAPEPADFCDRCGKPKVNGACPSPSPLCTPAETACECMPLAARGEPGDLEIYCPKCGKVFRAAETKAQQPDQTCCVCGDDKGWLSKPPPICAVYTPMPQEEGRCADCEHDRECHTSKIKGNET